MGIVGITKYLLTGMARCGVPARNEEGRNGWGRVDGMGMGGNGRKGSVGRRRPATGTTQRASSVSEEGYHLQECTDLHLGTWSATSASVGQVDSDCAATLPIDSNAKFYRLSQVAP